MRRAALLVVIVLVGAATPAVAQTPGSGCLEPVISFEVKPRSPAGFVKFHEVNLDARPSYRPGSPYSPITGFYDDWRQVYSAGFKNAVAQLSHVGWHRFGVEYATCDGSLAVAWQTVYAKDIAPWTNIPWAYRRYGDPRPIFIRGHAFVDDQQRIARVNSRGVALQVECPRWCIVDSALQITAYRARRLGLRVRGSRRNLALASHTDKAFDHHFRLRPDRAARRGLRTKRLVPARILVVIRALNGAKHVIRAPIELRR